MKTTKKINGNNNVHRNDFNRNSNGGICTGAR